MDKANLGAATVPLEVMEHAVTALRLALVAASDGNPSSVSDAGVAGLCALAAAEGASLNVRINMPQLDQDDATDLTERHDAVIALARTTAAEVTAAVDRVLDQS